MSGDTNLQMAGGAGERDGVGVSGVIRLSLVLSLDKICVQKEANPHPAGVF